MAVFALGPSDTDVVALPLCRGIDQLSHDDLADFPSLSDGIKKKREDVSLSAVPEVKNRSQ